MKNKSLGNMGVYKKILASVSDYTGFYVRLDSGEIRAVSDVSMTSEYGVVLNIEEKEDQDNI